MHFFAEPPFRPDAEAIPYQQHSDHQFGIDRGTTDRAIEWRRIPAIPINVDEPADLPQQMVAGNLILQRELTEQGTLCNLPRTHHRPVLQISQEN